MDILREVVSQWEFGIFEGGDKVASQLERQKRGIGWQEFVLWWCLIVEGGLAVWVSAETWSVFDGLWMWGWRVGMVFFVLSVVLLPFCGAMPALLDRMEFNSNLEVQVKLVRGAKSFESLVVGLLMWESWTAPKEERRDAVRELLVRIVQGEELTLGLVSGFLADRDTVKEIPVKIL